MEFLLLLGASLLATFYGVRFRSWWLVAVAAVLSLPFTLVAHIAYQVSWLLPFLQVAAAVALRWRVGAGGWLALLLTGLGRWPRRHPRASRLWPGAGHRPAGWLPRVGVATAAMGPRRAA